MSDIANVQNAGVGELCGEKPPLIPPGKYQLRMTHWETSVLFGKAPKVALQFQICNPGEHFGLKLARYYNVRAIKGKQGKFGGYQVGWRHELVREVARLLHLPSRLRRLDLTQLTKLVILGRVGTVERSARQKKLAPDMCYSVVQELIGVEAGAVSV